MTIKWFFTVQFCCRMADDIYDCNYSHFIVTECLHKQNKLDLICIAVFKEIMDCLFHYTDVNETGMTKLDKQNFSTINQCAKQWLSTNSKLKEALLKDVINCGSCQLQL